MRFGRRRRSPLPTPLPPIGHRNCARCSMEQGSHWPPWFCRLPLKPGPSNNAMRPPVVPRDMASIVPTPFPSRPRAAQRAFSSQAVRRIAEQVHCCGRFRKPAQGSRIQPARRLVRELHHEIRMFRLAESLAYPRPIGISLIRAAAGQPQYGKKCYFTVSTSLDLVSVFFQVTQRIFRSGGSTFVH